MGIVGHPWVVTILCMVGSFLICGIPFGLIIGKVFGHVDIRTAGSGNIGATNALRVGGPLVGGLTLLCDVVKGVVCVTVSKFLIARIGLGAGVAVVAPGSGNEVMVSLVALSCICGHVFSPYLKFHGGKGIAAGVGVLLALYPPLGLVSIAGFAVVVALTRYVSLASITGAVLAPISAFVLLPEASLAYKLLVVAMAALVIWAHRENIKRLVNGTESKLSFSARAGKGEDADESSNS